MSLVDDRSDIIADLEKKLQYARDVWQYYKQLMASNSIEGWERVDSGIQAIANYYKMEIVRVHHDIARYIHGHPVTGETKYGGYNYGNNIWTDIMLGDVENIQKGLVGITKYIKRRNKHDASSIWYKAWSAAIDLEFAWMESSTYRIEDNGKYLTERFTYSGEI